MRNVLITGANGFIGSAIAGALFKNYETKIVAMLFDKHATELPQADHLIYGDVRDSSLMRRVISDYEVTDVYHMAAQSIVSTCANDPVTAYDINVMGTVSILEACRIAGKNTVESVVVSTSDKAYGHSVPPYNEDTAMLPMFTYETSKTCQDLITRSYFHNYGVPAKVARCSNVYGPGDSNLSRLIPKSIHRIALGSAPVLYNGVHEFVREFVYIDDVVSAFECISKDGLGGEAYCVGGSGHYKILDVIEMILDIMGSDLKPEIVQKNSNFKEISKQWIDAAKLKGIGWVPAVAIMAGLRECVKYYASEKEIIDE